MSTSAKLAAYALGLVAVFGAALGIGAAVGPVGPPAAASHDTASHDTATHRGGTQPVAPPPSEHGHSLDVARELPAGAAAPLSFRILGPDGRPVAASEGDDQELSVVAVRRDPTGFQQVRAVPATDGTWSVPLELTPGSWRLFVDVDAAGDDPALVLAADVVIADHPHG